MVVLSLFFESVATLLHTVINIYIWIVIAGAILSWVNPDPFNPIVLTIRKLTEPAYRYIRYYLPVSFGAIDFAPIVLLLILQFLDLFLVRLLYHLASSIGQ